MAQEEGARNVSQGVWHRALAAVVDQLASSLANFVVLFAALHSLSVGGVGAFTAAYTSALLLITVVRALVLEPLTIRFTVVNSATRRKASAEAAGASLLIGLGILVVAFAVASVAGGLVRSALVGFAIAVPLLLLQDAWRMSFFASGRPWSAVTNDIACLGSISACTIAAVHWASPGNVAIFLFAWAAGTAVGAVAGMVQSRTIPRLGKALSWLTTHKDIGPALAGERSAESTAALVSLMLVGVLVSAQALGELGAARAIMAPVMMITTSITLFGLPEAARLRHAGHRLTVFAAMLSLITTGVVLGVTAALLIAPDWVGEFLAGKNWDTAKVLIVPVALWTAASGARRGPSVGLRALERGRTLLSLSVATGAVVLLATIAGCMVSGARGAAWAFAGTYILAVIAYWGAYLSARRSTLRRSSSFLPTPTE